MKTARPQDRRAELTALLVTALLVFNVSGTMAQQESSAAARSDKAIYAAIEKVPPTADRKPNPLEHDPEAVAAGGKLFEQHCAECHGMKAEGTRRAPSLLKEPVQQATPGALFWILTNGVVRHGMPVWSKLPGPERWQIVAFVKSFRGSTGNPPAASP